MMHSDDFEHRKREHADGIRNGGESRASIKGPDGEWRDIGRVTTSPKIEPEPTPEPERIDVSARWEVRIRMTDMNPDAWRAMILAAFIDADKLAAPEWFWTAVRIEENGIIRPAIMRVGRN